MKISITWQKPVQITKNKVILFYDDEIPDDIEERPGVYYFSRQHGNTRLPFYIGETLSIRKRLADHLKNGDIRDVLRGQFSDANIKNGTRYFHFGYLEGSRSKALAKRRLAIAQRLMIRQAIEERVPILNMKLARIPTHEVIFVGNKAGRGEYGRFHEVEIT